ncbi:class I SAM-dependent methyltransferase [Gammaproteobacteria bacterium]|nr:class I SAM-dependent methyltransferase [Gammaproteobacteria bacterium]
MKTYFILKYLLKESAKKTIHRFAPNYINPTLVGKCSESARYCYSVWLRHMVKAHENGLSTYPKTIAELGPGNSLGIGIAALISGCEKYYAFDVVKFANSEKNLEIFDEIVNLFVNRTPIPDNTEFPAIKPYLDNYDFPSNIFDEHRLKEALNKKRLNIIRNAVSDKFQNNSIIQYKVPWDNTDIEKKEIIDLIYSQAVLEHIDDLNNAYKSMYLWLKPAGYISHQIDYKSHSTAKYWNGHWTYSDIEWKIIRGMDKFLINRVPHSVHLSMIKENGFHILCDKKVILPSVLCASELAPNYCSLLSEDLVTSGSFLQCSKIDKRIS